MSDSGLGEIRYNTFGTPMKIIEYTNHGDITVEFLDQYRIQKNTTYSNFKIGQVRNPYDRNVKNVGYMGEGKYTSDGSQYIRRVFGVWLECWKDVILKICDTNILHMNIVLYVMNGIITKISESGMTVISIK